jgi:hypothetical protein
MNRRTAIGWVGASVLGVTLVAAAQSAKIPRIGFLRASRPPQSYIDAFERGLVERGYTPAKVF